VVASGFALAALVLRLIRHAWARAAALAPRLEKWASHDATQAEESRTKRLQTAAMALPVLTCLLCPVCLTAGTGILSALGVGMFLSEGTHRVVVGASLLLTVGAAVWLTRRHRRYGPLGMTLGGSLAVVIGCIVTEIPALEYSGTALILVGALWNWRLKSQRSPAALPLLPERGSHA
jgi:hypothetical protein